MNCESSESLSNPVNGETIGNDLKIVNVIERAGGINTYNFDDFLYNQYSTETPSSNENNVQSSAHNDYYYTTHAELQRQQNILTSEQSTRVSDVTFEQPTQQNVVLSANLQESQLAFPRATTYSTDDQQRQQEMTTQQQSVVEYYSTVVATTVTSILGSTSTFVASNRSSRHNSTSTLTNASPSPINSICAGADNANSTLSNYGTAEFCGSYPVNTTTLQLDNPEARPMNFTDNRSLEARYNRNMQQQPSVQTESVNSVLAHQWHQRREKLPTTRDAAFYTEWQVNRLAVVNTAEIQKRRLQFLEGRAGKKLGQANEQNKKATPKRTEQQHQSYRLHQMQQQNNLRSLTPDSLSSSQRFANSPLSANSSTGSGQQPQQQTFPYAHPQLPLQIQVQEALPPNNANSMYNLPTHPQMQLLQMQALQQQQYLQQQLIQSCQPTYSPDFFESWQKLNQQRYDEALQENTVRHKGARGSRQASRKRKRQNSPQEVAADKENASVNSFEPALVIDETAVEPLNVLLVQDSKCDDNLEAKLASSQGEIEERVVVVNLGDFKMLSSKSGKNAKDQRSTEQLPLPPADNPSGMWLNNYPMLQDWIEKQQQTIDEGGMMQYKHSDMD